MHIVPNSEVRNSWSRISSNIELKEAVLVQKNRMPHAVILSVPHIKKILELLDSASLYIDTRNEDEEADKLQGTILELLRDYREIYGYGHLRHR